MINKLEDYYYIIHKAHGKQMIIAKYNPKYQTFYDRKRISALEFYNIEKTGLKIGSKVEETEGGEFKVGEVQEEIIKIINEKEQQEKEWEEKHPDLWPSFQSTPTTTSIIDNYFNKEIEAGKKVDPYILEIVHILSEAMGIKVRWRHGGRMYNQLGFDYPEEVEISIRAIYDLIEEYLDNNEKTFMFVLYEYGKCNDEYKNFKKELNKRTGFSFSSDLQYEIDDEKYHGENFGFSERYRKLSIQKPTIYISRKETTYCYDIANSNSTKIKTTPEECEQKYNLKSKYNKIETVFSDGNNFNDLSADVPNTSDSTMKPM